MDKKIFQSLIADMFALIKANKDDEVCKRFGISKEIIDEIRETISDYFGDWQEIKPIDINRRPESRANKPLFDVFEMNQLDTYGVECVLVDANENETELIFHAEFVAINDGYNLLYKYIGS